MTAHHPRSHRRAPAHTRTNTSKIVEILGREPTYTELGIFSVMWSEHCSYKSSRLHLKKLPTRRQAACCRARARTPASSTSATAGPSPSRSNRTTTRASSSRSRARRPASAASSATSSPWARGPIAVLDALRFGPLDDPRYRRAQPPHRRGRGRRHRALRQLLRRPDGRRRDASSRTATTAIRW